MNAYFYLYIFAQSAGEAAQETAEETKQLLTKITTLKITQAVIVLLACYIILSLIDKLVVWISERIAREWRLQVKQSAQSRWREPKKELLENGDCRLNSLFLFCGL